MTGNLVGHWPLSEDSGSTAYDYSGNENHGSVTGAGPAGTGTVAGPFGNSAYSFDGSDDFVSTSGLNFFSTDSFFTISAWFSEGGDTQRILSRRDTSNGDRIELFINSGVGCVVDDDAGNVATLTSSESVVNTGWRHVLFTFNGSLDTVQLFLDGVLVGSDSTSMSGTLNVSNPDIGRRGGDNDNYFTGNIADVRIYNRILSPQEVQYLYQASKKSEAAFKVQTK